MLILDEILRKRNMTETELAHRMGVSVQSVNYVVRQRGNTSVKKLKRYADALGLPLKELFNDEIF